MKFKQIFSTSNSKLNKDNIASFGLANITTCPRAGACKSYCMINKGAYTWPARKNLEARNLALTESPNFITTVNQALQSYKGRFKIIRIHDGGDFYNANYFTKWVQIAIDNPQYKFYAYTKSFAIIDPELAPDNFKLIQSLGGLDDNKIDKSRPHARIFANAKLLKKEGYIDCSKSDLKAQKTGAVKIGLIMH